LNEGRAMLSAKMNLVSGNIRLTRIFAGFLGDEASNDSGVIENVDFQGVRELRSSAP